MYDFANITGANSTLQILQSVNTDWSGGILGIMILLVLGVIVFMNLSAYGTKETFLVTTFYISIMAGLLWLSGLVGMYVLIICIVLLFVAVLLTILMGDK